ncbi:MAG: diguanylate cyclase, partial [Actinomycetota bacterium]|nr:diguanylate cyclase [Actinomycetota bacterium]
MTIPTNGSEGSTPRPLADRRRTPPTPAVPAYDTALPSQLGTIGRFRLDHLVKEGSGVATYAATDTADGLPVILKTVVTKGLSSAVCVRLQHEADVLERLDVAARPLVASGTEGGLFYLVQRRLEGRTLRARLDEGPIGLHDVLRLAIDLLDRLQVVHDRGVLHRDIKPSNVLISNEDTELRAELIDFGLARSSRLDGSVREELVGTARYLAPEAAGLLDLPVDERSDLYSVGALLFECCTGQPRFAGGTVGEVLRQLLNSAPPSLRALGITVPRAWDGALQRLLAKDPDARYQSATSALADLRELSSALEAGIAEPPLTLGRHDLRRTLTEPSFVSRSLELDRLTGMIRQTLAGDGQLVLVEAQSGGGKTRLLDELALHAAREDFWVLRGQGVDHAAQRPFQMLDGVVTGIAANDLDSATMEAVRDHLGDRAGAVVAALPDLAGPLRARPPQGLGPEQYAEARSVDALAALLDSLGSGDHPALVVLDDCQWADGLTISLLARWQAARSDAQSRRVLVVVAFRSEEVAAAHPLRSVGPSEVLALAPFGDDDVRTLCASMAGALPDPALDTIVRLAEGSPFMAAAVLRGMVESGALVSSTSGWAIDSVELSEAQTSRRAALFLARRFDLLEPPTLRLLTAGAVLGKQFELGLASVLAGIDGAVVRTALDDARHRQIIWIDDSTEVGSFTHDKLRETLLDRLEAEDRRQLHLQAAEHIEGLDPSRMFELAYHFDAAGELARALPYAHQVAVRARTQHALDASATHYRIAERASRSMPQLHAEITEGLGDVLTLQGNYAEAATVLEQALALTSDPVGRAVLDGKLGDVAFKRGDQVVARGHLERALGDLGHRVPRTGLGWVLAALREALVQLCHSLVPRLFVGRRSVEGADEEFLAIRMYSRLAYVYWFSAGKIPCAWSHLREMNLAERYPPTLELAQAYSEHAPVMTMVPWYGRGLSYAHRSYEIRRDLGDVWGQGQSLNFHGVVLYAASRYRACIEQCQEAVRVLERTGDRWEQNTATWTMVFAHYRLGELDVATDLARRLYATASSIGDRTAAGVVLSGWARADRGQVPAEHIAAELEHETGDAQTAAEIRLADGLRHLYDGELDAAVDRLTQADGIVRRAGLRQEYVAPVKPWLATALRMQLEQAGAHASSRDRAGRLRHAARVARQADRLSRSYRNNRPHALRERALVADLAGRAGRADRLLLRSLEVALAQEAGYEAALTRVAMARLEAARSASETAGSSLVAAEAALAAVERKATDLDAEVAEPEARDTLSLADRFELLLAVGRRLGAATSPNAVYEGVREAALLLLRGDRCHVVEVADDLGEILTTASGANVQELSHRVLSRAVEQRMPVVDRPGEDADADESMVLAGLKSVLCAPILCDDEVVACFYVTHYEVDDLFGDIELQLAEFIATVAGAALEHVAGSEARFRSLVHNSSDVITIVGADGRITYQSSSIERVFGYRPEEVVGREYSSWLHREASADLMAFLASPSFGPDGTSVVTSMVRHRDGSFRDIETRVTDMLDDPGVRGLVLNSRDISERVELEKQLKHQAWHDWLTGLPNRQRFVDLVDAALADRRRDGGRLAIAFLDLDDFKAINTKFGHPGGDELLALMGQRLAECVRPEDTVARFGGDEFAILLQHADAEAAAQLAARIIAELERPFELGDHEVHARASIGLALSDGTDTSDDLHAMADTAMYVAKRRGRSRYEVFEPAMRDEALERENLHEDLEKAVGR